ncbi:MAG: phosphatase PAP2 family protein [Motiliproteus sp.]|nr:phosphatase PAP2 family protein [Motiliproteus sp.]
MIHAKPEGFFQRVSHYELGICEKFNNACQQRLTVRFFAIISRLGDGILWYLLMVLLPFVYGTEALPVSLAMGVTALFGVLFYKLLKTGTSRPRPYKVNHRIRLGTAPLDQFSFPSGHTLHAVAFSMIAISQYPELTWLLTPFVVLVALSRIVLGLHYPTDVLAGGSLGAILATAAIPLI